MARPAGDSPDGRLGRLDCGALTPVVRKALGDPRAEVSSWKCRIVKREPRPAGRRVCHVLGRARSGGREVPWSVFLKVPNATRTHMDAWHREPFQREVRVYECGLLDCLPGGIAAPRCLGIVQADSEQPWIWLEDVPGLPGTQWHARRFARTAHEFGVLQGAFLAGRPLPDEPWLDTGAWLREQFSTISGRIPGILGKLATHPCTRRLSASELGGRLGWLWARREAVLDALEAMPRSLCHGDFNCSNFLSRPRDGRDETVVLDWQYAGRRQIGGDIAGLIADSSVCPVRCNVAEPEEFTELILDSYLAGLRGGGWSANGDIPRFACLARLGWQWSFNLLWGLAGSVLNQSGGAQRRAELTARVDEYVRRQRFLLGLAEESLRLLQGIKRRP